ncbi:MAG TPA: hypothetical protein VMB48_12170 [Steroidobacteraceae bacterium]|nr:hypothetical protein [Steroidobacteraceae bacterium]
MARNFVRYTRSRSDRRQRVPLRITDMTAADAWWWDRRMGPHHFRQPQRADRWWAWSVLLPACHLIQLAKQRYCRPLVIWAPIDDGRFMRVAMSIQIERYPHLDVRVPAEVGFVWFISAADHEVLRAQFGMSHAPTLGRALLDNAMVLSAHEGLEGRIGLHAAPAGGQELLALYRRCGLLQLPQATALPPSIQRRNDGRFFYADEPTAERLCKSLDADR